MDLLSCSDFFSKLTFSKKFFQEPYQSVKWFGSRSGPTNGEILQSTKLHRFYILCTIHEISFLDVFFFFQHFFFMFFFLTL